MNPVTKPHVIGELMNNSYARARRAWLARDLNGYRQLASSQAALGASFLTLNVDGTQTLSISLEDMLAFLPKVIPAIQEVTDLPISFDNPAVAFHIEAMKHFNRSKSRGRPILNSLSVSRQNIDAMIRVAADNDMDVIVMASEGNDPQGGHRAATTPDDILRTSLEFARLLHDRAGMTPSRMIIDPGLCPIASDTVGGVDLCLDAIRAIRNHPELEGVHISFGLSNFSIGAPKELRIPLERAILRLAMDSGLDYALANPEKNTEPLPAGDDLVSKLRAILEEGRARAGETAEDAGFRQLDALMELWPASAS